MKVRITSVPKQSKARNAKKWHHKEDGGDVFDDTMYDEADYGMKMLGEGNIQPISSNPYSEPILGHDGPLHEDGGIKHQQFGRNIESEGGETQYGNNILGNMTFPKVQGQSVEGFTGKKFKNIGKDIAENENKAQKVGTKSQALLKADAEDKFGALTYNSGIVLADATSQKQKALTAQKDMLVRIQQGMLDLSEQSGTKPEQMHKQFKKGGMIKAVNGKDMSDNTPLTAEDRKYFDQLLKKNPDMFNQDYNQGRSGANRKGFGKDNLWGPGYRNVKDHASAYDNTDSDNYHMDVPAIDWNNREKINPMPGPDVPMKRMPNVELNQMNDKPTAPPAPGKPGSLADYNKIGWADMLPAARYLLEQPDQVTSQQYNPRLMDPYQVSFQDRINRNNGALKAIAQQVPGNPAALSALAAGTYDANNEVAGEEFRANQGIFNSVMNNNYALMNEAQKTNIQLNDQQMVRQSQAKSNTDAHKAQALKYIADTIDQNRYENMNLRMIEARHKYTYDADRNQMVLNKGTQAPFDFSGMSNSNGYNPGEETREYDADGNLIKTTKKTKMQPAAVPTAKWSGMFK